MAIHKHALIRYYALDKCLANRRVRYDYNALKAAVDKALRDADPLSKGIGRSQLFKDLDFLESPAGYSAEIEKYRDGGKEVYRRYKDASFSIRNAPINELEITQLREAISVLRQFHGLPQFEWLDETTAKLQEGVDTTAVQPIISFDSNQYLRGIQHLGTLYNAARYNRAVIVKYCPFNIEPYELVFSTWHLKQYNNRWFAFGSSPESEYALVTLALDRIESIRESQQPYVHNERINFSEYFEDIVGVTRPAEQTVEDVELRIAPARAGYVLTKPLHGSQRAWKAEDGSLLVRLRIMVNPELLTLLLSFGDSLQVLAPDALATKLKETIERMRESYS